MASDPEQLKPIKDEKVSRKLKEALAKYKTEVLSEYGGNKDERDFVIAHPGSKLTQLPARDAVATGGLNRSNRFPNDSYFESWKSIDDRITWKAEAGESGVFEVEIFYATKLGGAKYRLSFNGSELDFVIPDAHNVPKLGAEEDRSPRNESYTKDWARLKVGRIKLTKGEGELVLEALKIPGNEAMEFRLLTLRRIE